MHSVQGKRVTVLGLGHFGGGIAVSRWLVEQGAKVLVTDRESADKLAGSVLQLQGLPIGFHLGEQREEDFTSADLIVTSPAVPPNNPILQKATEAGVPITTEICLFIERCTAPIVGVTGTKGKSTTTALLGRMLEKQFTTWVGGNIGRSLLADLPRIKQDDIVLLELSSFMLHHLRALNWSPHAAVVTMLSSDHIEWHGSPDAYIDAKLNIIRFQKPTDIAVLNCADPAAKPFFETAKAKIIEYGNVQRRLALKLPGEHNQLNGQAALAAAMALGISFENAQAATVDFCGLPHRLQVVLEDEGVMWVNDSIATIPEAAAAALRAFPKGRVIQIVGGYDKHLPMNSMIDALSEGAKAVLCIGQLGPPIGAALRDGKCPHVEECGDLTKAVQQARMLSAPGDVVLLSPGCASYDQFDNFEKRGEMFTRLARG
ncbi:MAG: UDP-N-acetylmuramoyl-L-alanine--D-glutamate ligase [Phycisphaerae bacterium]|nr:UDP-N-acetylmuramoyl-L-alanine--D-glutamate ligase [Phycisphaerae bacterium]